MRKPNFRAVGQAFRKAGRGIANAARKGKQGVRNYFEARSAANKNVVMSRAEARRMGGMWPEYRKEDKRKIMRRVLREGLSAVVHEMEQRIISYGSRQYQPKEVKLRKADGSVRVLTGLDAERARIPKLKEISRLSGERQAVLRRCETVIINSKLSRVVEDLRPKPLRQFSDLLGKVFTRRRPYVEAIQEYRVNNSSYGTRFSISSAGSYTIEHFRDRLLVDTEEYRLKPEEVGEFKEYHRATRRWLDSLDEYQRQEWVEA